MAQRVHEVAKEMGKSAAAVVAAMKKIGINKKALSTLTDEEIARVRSLEIEEVEVDGTASAKKARVKKETSAKKAATKEEKAAKKAAVKKEKSSRKVAVKEDSSVEKERVKKEVPAEKVTAPQKLNLRPSLRKTTKLRIRLLGRDKL